MLAGAAFAGLFAGTGAPFKASTLLSSLKTGSAQEQSQDQTKKKKDDKQVKEKHASKATTLARAGRLQVGDTVAKAKTLQGKGGCRPMVQENPSNCNRICCHVGWRAGTIFSCPL